MQSLLEDLWLYQKNQDSRALAEAEALLAAEDESTRRQAANHFVRCVLAEAAQHDFRKNLWQSCVTYYIAANENAFSLREERRQEAADEASCGKDPFARHDCSLLRRLFSLALAAEAQKPGAEVLAALADYEPFRAGSAEGMLIVQL